MHLMERNAILNMIVLYVEQLVEISNEARMKISEEVKKVTIPGKKDVYRLYGHDGKHGAKVKDYLKCSNMIIPHYVLCIRDYAKFRKVFVVFTLF